MRARPGPFPGLRRRVARVRRLRCHRRGLRGCDAGTALVLAMFFTVLLLTLGTGLILVASVERTIAGTYEAALQGQYAAEGVAELAVRGLSAIQDWSGVLDGSLKSPWTDGAAGGTRLLADRTPISLTQVVNMADCGKTTSCTSADIEAVTADRPWGADNPRWQLFAYGYLDQLVAAAAGTSPEYVVALVGDDPRENDGDPSKDGSTDDNPGCGILSILAEAFGARGAGSAVQVTVARSCSGMVSDNPVRVVAWREIP